MNGHLNDEQWAAAVLKTSDAEAAQHLAECTACHGELEALAAAAAVARNQARTMEALPEAFWRRQRLAIGSRLAARDLEHPWKRRVWATAAVLLILLASVLVFRRPAPPAQAVAPPDPDDELLLTVQQSIQSDLPQAMRPAALLTREIDRAAIRRNP